MRRLVVAALLAAGGALLMWGCSPQERLHPPVRQEMKTAARQQDWALVYFQSWREHRDAAYLNLSRRHMARAVKTYFDLQLRIGHSYPDFYVIDQRRRSGCLFLDEIDRLAQRFRVVLADTTAEGCLRGS